MFVHGGYDFLGVIHICVVACAFLLGSTLRARIRFFQEYLIPAPMIGGVFLFLFYNFAAGRLGLTGGKQFLEAMMFHLLNISFIAMQLRMPVHTKLQRKARVKQNVCALMAEYGMQGFFGLLAVILVFNKRYAGAARSLGLTLCLGFERGPGQAESLAKVWEGAPYNVYNAGNVGLAMAAIGFVTGSVVGVFLINRAARKGWLSYEYVDQLKHRKAGNGFFKRKQDSAPSGFQTTSSDTMDSFTLHIALIMFAYMLSYLFLSGVEYLVAKYVGGKPLEVVKGFWGINFIVSSLFARLERWFLIVTHSPHVVDNATCNRIDGIAVDFMVIACLGAIEVVTIKTYWLLILV
ncbi:MAG: sodium:glutamate symporter, partial [Sphaerochaetaceae bacterium]|nr:sodium:glutamate symporter [Sphaerochaetaceae bacterium]